MVFILEIYELTIYFLIITKNEANLYKSGPLYSTTVTVCSESTVTNGSLHYLLTEANPIHRLCGCVWACVCPCK